MVVTQELFIQRMNGWINGQMEKCLCIIIHLGASPAGGRTFTLPPWSPDSFYISYSLGLELARASTPRFLCPRQNQTAPVSSPLQLPRASPQLGNACPVRWGLEALAKGLGVARRPSLPPVSSLRPDAQKKTGLRRRKGWPVVSTSLGPANARPLAVCGGI